MSERLPLAAKHLLGATRQFVYALETCQRLPAGALLFYEAATTPAAP